MVAFSHVFLFFFSQGRGKRHHAACYISEEQPAPVIHIWRPFDVLPFGASWAGGKIAAPVYCPFLLTCTRIVED